MRKNTLIKKLQKYFSNLKGVSLAFLFGSFSKGREAFLSDIDVAVYLDDLNLEDKIWLELEQLAKREVDLIVINKASPRISWTALKEGIPLFIKDKSFYLDLVLEISSEAEDLIEFNLDFLKKKEKLYGYQ